MNTVRQRHLPHWDVPGSTYFVTACLAGSIPAQGLLEIEQFRDKLTGTLRPTEIAEQEWKSRCWKSVFVQSEKWLDEHPAVRHLADPLLAKIVADALYFFAGKRYDLFAYVVMPSHFHWVFRPYVVGQVCNDPPNVGQVCNLSVGANSTPPQSLHDRLQTCPTKRPPREQIMHSIKRYTARLCNQYLGRRGTFWQDESHDHCVRDLDELERIVRYTEQNPVKAGLVSSPEAWHFSSAYDRLCQKAGIDQPLQRP